LLYAIIFGVFVSISQKPGIIAIYVILAIIGTIAFIGLILNSISFGKGRNIFNILGFIFSLIVIIWYFMAIGLFATSGL
jgi:hypothetical protein